MPRALLAALTSVALLRPCDALGNVVGTDIQNFNPTTSGLDFLTVQSSETLTPGIFNVGLFVNHAVNTLPRYDSDDDGSGFEKDDSILGADLNMGVGLMNRWDLGISLPQILRQEVDIDGEHGEYDSTGNTEIRINTKVRLAGERSGGVAVVGTVGINRIENNPYTGADAPPTRTLELVLDNTTGRVAYGLNVGYRWRTPGEPVPDFPVVPYDDQYIASGAVSYHAPSLDTKFIVEAYGSRPTRHTDDDDTYKQQSSAEILGGLKFDATDNIALHSGVGRSLIEGVSSPDIRFYAGVNWVFGPVFAKEEKGFVKQTKKKRSHTRTVHIHKHAVLQPDDADATDGESYVMEDVNFAYDSASKVYPGAFDSLREFHRGVLKSAKYKWLIVSGHTDSMGSEEYNLDLSRRRASAIRKVLVDTFDIPADAIKVVAYGESRPIADNGNYQGRRRNRRVEIKIVPD